MVIYHSIASLENPLVVVTTSDFRGQNQRELRDTFAGATTHLVA
jgi:hypothetical protein